MKEFLYFVTAAGSVIAAFLINVHEAAFLAIVFWAISWALIWNYKNERIEFEDEEEMSEKITETITSNDNQNMNKKIDNNMEGIGHSLNNNQSRKEITIRDLDNAFNDQEINRIEKSVNSRNNFIGAIILVSVYIFASTLFFGVFGYRGGTPEIGENGYFFDILVIGFVVFGATRDDKSNIRWLSIALGTGMFLTGDILIKNFFLYPLITHLLGMR